MNKKIIRKREKFLKNKDKIRAKIVKRRANSYIYHRRIVRFAGFLSFILMSCILYSVSYYVFNYRYALEGAMKDYQLWIEISIAVMLAAVFYKAKEQHLEDLCLDLLSPLLQHYKKYQEKANYLLYMHDYCAGDTPKYKYNKKKRK